MTLATVSWALKPPTEKFPFGFGKVESLGSLGVSSILLGGGLFMGYSALFQLCQIYLPGFIEGAAHAGFLSCLPEHSHHVPDMGAAWLAGGSVIIKEWLYRASMLNLTGNLPAIANTFSHESRKGTQIRCS